MPCFALPSCRPPLSFHPRLPPLPWTVDAQDLKDAVAGQYRLASGLDVRLSLVDQQLYADLNRHYRKRVFPVSPNLLSSQDGNLTIEYLPDGPVERILIRHQRFPQGQRLGERSWLGK